MKLEGSIFYKMVRNRFNALLVENGWPKRHNHGEKKKHNLCKKQRHNHCERLFFN